LDEFDLTAHKIGLILTNDFDGQIRASELAKPAADAVLRPRRHDFFFIIQVEHVFWAKMHAYAAALAPIPLYTMLFNFWLVFWHLDSAKLTEIRRLTLC